MPVIFVNVVALVLPLFKFSAVELDEVLMEIVRKTEAGVRTARMDESTLIIKKPDSG
nr:hypothetical protein [Pedobacter panaciterrae]